MTTVAGACLAASLDDSGLFRKAVHEEGFIGIGLACKRGLNGRDWGRVPEAPVGRPLSRHRFLQSIRDATFATSA
jgi:hypothetical protein